MMIAPIAPESLNYEEAICYVLTLNYNGYKDWRLPTQQEYISNNDIDSSVWNDHSIELAMSGDYHEFRRKLQPVRTQ